MPPGRIPHGPVRHVLVPGLGLDGRSSARLRALVAAEVVLLPGMGLAAPVPSLDALAGRLLAALGEGPVVLTGHSQGSQVVAVAATDPRVVGVVLLGPTTDPRLRSVPGLGRQWLRTAVHEPLGSVPTILTQWWRTGPRSMVELWRSVSPDRIEDRLAAVPVPVVVVRGTRDRLCTADFAARVAASAPQGRVIELPGAAHLTPQTHPDEIAGILGGYWPSVRPRTSA